MSAQRPGPAAPSPELDEAWIADALERYASVPPDRRDGALRDEIFRRARWLAIRGARRFSDRGEPFDDLVQVAGIGLLKAIDRFDPSLGVPFGSYATPTILGELRRHFRDHTWSVRVPRRAKDLRQSVSTATEALQRDLGRSPTVAELAAHLSLTPDMVLEVLEANNAYRARPLDHANTLDQVVGDDADRVLDRELIVSLLDRLRPRERTILYLRFFEEMSQSEIAARVGTSQVHVGRLIASSLAALRDHVTAAPGSAASESAVSGSAARAPAGPARVPPPGQGYQTAPAARPGRRGHPVPAERHTAPAGTPSARSKDPGPNTRPNDTRPNDTRPNDPTTGAPDMSQTTDQTTTSDDTTRNGSAVTGSRTSDSSPVTSRRQARFTVPTLSLEQGADVGERLQQRLVSLIDLGLTLKHIHWNVVGPNFIAVHEMLDPQYAGVQEMVDDLAERIATLGCVPSGLPGRIVEQRSWDDYELDRADSIAHLGALDLVYHGVIEDHRAEIEALEHLDPVTQDLLIGQTATLERYHWFVRSHLADWAGGTANAGASSEMAAARAVSAKTHTATGSRTSRTANDEVRR